MTTALGILALIVAGFALPDDRDGNKAGTKAVTRPSAEAPPDFDYDRESAARAFVAQHHPELIALLDRLKTMSPVEYEKAIVELFQVRQNLAALRNRDPNRYHPALDAWKAKSRVDVLAAQYVIKPTADLESSLRQAIAVQVDCDLALRKFDRDAIAARLQKANDQIARMESQRDSSIENRLNALRKKAPKVKAKAKARAAGRTGKSSPPPVLASPEDPTNPTQKGKP